MSIVSQNEQEIKFKIVLWGTVLTGKSTNMRWLYEHLPAREGFSLIREADADPTLCFGFIPPNRTTVEGYQSQFYVYNAYSIMYGDVRRLILAGVDAVVLICDSQADRRQMNRTALDLLRQTLDDAPHHSSLAGLPHVVQYNKRDLDNILPVETLRHEFNPYGAPDFEAVAKRGSNVVECLEAVMTLVLDSRPPTVDLS